MSRRGTGIIFCCIAAFMFAIPYFIVAVSISGQQIIYLLLNKGGFKRFFGEGYIPGYILPMVISGLMLAAGILYLFMAEKKNRRLFCPECRKEATTEGKYCEECGKKLVRMSW